MFTSPGGLVKMAAPSISAEIKSEPSKTVSSIRQSKFLSDKMIELLNKQVGIELFSAFKYLMASAWFQSKGLAGFQAWMDDQGQGELDHAQKVYRFLVETGSKVSIPAIPAVTIDWKDVPEVTRAVLDHEMFVTSCWKDIATLAKNEDNPASLKVAQEFLEEQIEEEDNALTLHQKVQMADTGTGVLVVDSDLKEYKPAQGKEASVKINPEAFLAGYLDKTARPAPQDDRDKTIPGVTKVPEAKGSTGPIKPVTQVPGKDIPSQATPYEPVLPEDLKPSPAGIEPAKPVNPVPPAPTIKPAIPPPIPMKKNAAASIADLSTPQEGQGDFTSGEKADITAKTKANPIPVAPVPKPDPAVAANRAATLKRIQAKQQRPPIQQPPMANVAGFWDRPMSAIGTDVRSILQRNKQTPAPPR